MFLVLLLAVGIASPALAYTFAWPEFRGNSFRTGQTPNDILGPDNPVLAWSWAPGARLGIPIVGKDGEVYVGAEDGSVAGLHADGSIAFSNQALGPVFYPPVLTSQGMVYVSGNPDGPGLTYLEAYRPGGAGWTYTPPAGKIMTAPLVDGTAIYFGLVDQSSGTTHTSLVAVDLDGQTLWSTPLEWGGQPGGLPSLAPALWRGADATTQILLGTAAGPNSELGGLWRFREDGSIAVYNPMGLGLEGMPAVGQDRTIYAATASGALEVYSDGGAYSGSPSLGLGGATVWNGSPAVSADGTIYVGVNLPDGSGSLMAINQTGNILWGISYAFGMADVRPVVDGAGTIYFATTRLSFDYAAQTTRCDVFAIRPDGSEKWHFEHQLATPCAPVSRFGYAPDLAFGRNTLYLAAGNELLAITQGAPSPTPSPSPTEPPLFSDLPSDYWALDSIKKLVDYGVLNGYPDGAFRAEKAVTRAEFCKMILLGLSYPLGVSASPTFPDAPPDHWAYTYVETAFKEGLAIGYPDGSFRPEGYITIAEILTILVRAAQWVKVNPTPPPTFFVKEPDGAVRNLSSADWFYQTVGAAFTHHLLLYPEDPHLATEGAGSGELSVAFNTPATRAQTAVFLWRLMGQA